MKIVAINGSLTPGVSRTRIAIDVALAAASEVGAEAQVLELRDYDLEFCDGRAPGTYGKSTLSAFRVLDDADAYIFASPIYRGTYTGALKNFLDLIPNGQDGWDPLRGKTVGLIATGGSLRHFMALDHGLRPIFAFFGATTLARGVYLSTEDFDPARQPTGEAAEQLAQLGRELVRHCRALDTQDRG